MKSIQRAHIVVVADSDQGLVLSARLLQMDVARVTTVASLDEARGMCQKGGADACIVAFDEAVPDAKPMAESDAPGRNCGVPSLMVVPTITPYLRKTARRRGYMAAVPAAIAPRMLYRRIGAALQLRRAASRRRRMPGGIVVPVAVLLRRAAIGKPTLH
jgi:DNA-binding NtrC family response regulator